VRKTAAELQIKEFYGACAPAEKENLIRKLGGKEKILFFGDGLNDAMALQSSDLSVSFVNRHQILNSAADVLLLRDDPQLLVQFLNIRERALRKIRQNLAIALAYNVLLLPLAMTGLLAPVAGAIFMGLSSLSVTANALLLSRR
jgi:Cu2+-exporting ATPase